MTKSKKTPASKKEKLDVGKVLLEGFYKEIQEDKMDLWPDAAMKRLLDITNKFVESEKDAVLEAVLHDPRIDSVAEARKLHHYAVDLFYDTYFGKPLGAPRLNDKYLEHLSKLREQGLSYGQIAKKLGLLTSPPRELTKSVDKIRKQLEEAEDRGLTANKRKA